jgi:hypothetical protein
MSKGAGLQPLALYFGGGGVTQIPAECKQILRAISTEFLSKSRSSRFGGGSSVPFSRIALYSWNAKVRDGFINLPLGNFDHKSLLTYQALTAGHFSSEPAFILRNRRRRREREKPQH